MSGKKFRLEVILLLLLLSLLTLPPNSVSSNSVSTLAKDISSSNPSRKPKRIKSPYIYTPPKNLKKIKAQSVGTGSRGCNRANLAKVGLRLFIPKHHIGLTHLPKPLNMIQPLKI